MESIVKDIEQNSRFVGNFFKYKNSNLEINANLIKPKSIRYIYIIFVINNSLYNVFFVHNYLTDMFEFKNAIIHEDVSSQQLLYTFEDCKIQDSSQFFNQINITSIDQIYTLCHAILKTITFHLK